MLRSITVSLFCLVPLAACAQAPPSPLPHDWNLVQRLDPGSEIHLHYTAVSAGRTMGNVHIAHEICSFVAATADEISCTKTQRVFFVPIHTTLRVPRDQVALIRRGRTSVSAALGTFLGIGAGLATSAVLIAASSESNHEDDILLYSLLALLGGFIGNAIGHHTDFAGGPTLYVAP